MEYIHYSAYAEPYQEKRQQSLCLLAIMKGAL